MLPVNAHLSGVATSAGVADGSCAGSLSAVQVSGRLHGMMPVPGTLQEGGAGFASTHWSVVLRAAQSQSSDTTRDAMSVLCRSYWPPLYTFLRRRGYPPADAKDLVQGFFVHLLEHDTLSRADREKGRLRTFLLGAMQYFVANERARTLKRGGGQPLVSLDADLAAVEASIQTSGDGEPDAFYDRKWAATLADRAWERLETAYAKEGKQAWLETLKPVMFGGSVTPLSQEQLAVQLGQSPSTLRVSLHRLRERYRRILREEVARTVSTPSEVDEEMSYLLRVLVS